MLNLASKHLVITIIIMYMINGLVEDDDVREMTSSARDEKCDAAALLLLAYHVKSERGEEERSLYPIPFSFVLSSK